MEGTIREVQKRDATIELLRFFFCCFIMAHHSYLIGNEGEYPFRAGWRYVEAFFFLSGYFTIRHFAKDDISYKAHEGKAAIIYSIRKIYGVLPMVICCILGNWILIASSTGVGGYQWFKSALPLLPEMLLMYMSGFGTSITVASFWYLSAMLFALPFVIYLCLKKKDLFKFIICPVVSWMVYGYLITTSIGTGAPGMIQWDGFFGGGGMSKLAFYERLPGFAWDA